MPGHRNGAGHICRATRRKVTPATIAGVPINAPRFVRQGRDGGMFVLEGIGVAEYIARISYGKDSLKMLEVIHSRGLPLDRITTTDVWATDTISANLPPMDAFKAKMDQRIWELYHIEVEHLCARNKDGSKKTYEQMFYHVPVRRSQIGQVERERRFHPGSILGFPDILHPWCQAALKKVAAPPWDNQGVSRNRPSQMVSGTQDRQGTTDSRLRSPLGAESSKSTRSKHLFR